MQLQLANRVSELESVAHFLNRPVTGPSIKMFVAKPRSGVSHFFRYCALNPPANGASIYVDSANKVANSIFSQLFGTLQERYPDLWVDLVRYLEDRAGRSKGREFMLAALTCVPHFGPAIARAHEVLNPTLSVTPYPSVLAELVAEFLTTLRTSTHLTIFIDNVQALDDWSMNLLAATIGQRTQNVRYVVAFVEREPSISAADFSIRVGGIGYQVVQKEFPSPDADFIWSYASTHDLDVRLDECRAIAGAAQGDIYRIRAALAARDQLPTPGSRWTPIKKALVGLLATAEQDLRLSDLLALCFQDRALFIEQEEQVLGQLDQLAVEGTLYRRALDDGDQLISLAPGAAVAAELVELGQVESLRLKAMLYDYYQRAHRAPGRHSKAELALLLYRLAKVVDPDRLDDRLRDVVSLSLQMGSHSIAQEYVKQATKRSHSAPVGLADFVTDLAFLVSLKQYSRVLASIDEAANRKWRPVRIVRTFRAIALNRTRRHRESEREFAALAREATSPEELVLLVSYRIVGQVHSNNMKRARRLFNAYESRVTLAANFGYFLRNGAEAFETERAVRLLTEALVYLEESGDRFGYATSLCNRGAKRAQIGQADDGLKDVEQSVAELELFGVHHLGLATANIGHCQIFRREFFEAERALRQAMRFVKTGLPRAYLEINMAVSLLFQGQVEEALTLVNRVAEGAVNAAVDRVRQKAYLNAALIHKWAGSGREMVDHYATKALQHPDRRDPARTARVVGEIRMLSEHDAISIDHFFDLFSPCSLLYWYQNPLEGLPGYLLPAEAVTHDAGHHVPM